MEKNFNRRAFLRKAAGVAATIAVAPFFGSSIISGNSSLLKTSDDTPSGEKPKIHPDIQVYCMKNGHIELSTSPKSATKISHMYRGGFEVDVLMLIACHKAIDANLMDLATRYSMPESTCRRKTDALIAELKSKGLIYYGDPQAIKHTGILSA